MVELQAGDLHRGTGLDFDLQAALALLQLQPPHGGSDGECPAALLPVHLPFAQLDKGADRHEQFLALPQDDRLSGGSRQLVRPFHDRPARDALALIADLHLVRAARLQVQPERAERLRERGVELGVARLTDCAHHTGLAVQRHAHGARSGSGSDTGGGERQGKRDQGLTEFHSASLQPDRVERHETGITGRSVSNEKNG